MNPSADRDISRRDYTRVRLPRSLAGSPEERQRRVIDALWEALAPTGVSWIGFYSKTPGRDEMLLGARRDKPACSPIGLHGVCGRGWTLRRPVVVRDVAVLGADYVACDPRDRSEVVVPMFDADGACWGVIDADSWEASAFSEHDAVELRALLERAGITSAPPSGAERGALVL